MSKYYRAADDAQYETWLEGKWVEVEVDEWHPVTQPPKPEDFEPTGFIEFLDCRCKPPYPDKMPSNAPWHLPDDAVWRKITPPK
jgi:hypothetical protein